MTRDEFMDIASKEIDQMLVTQKNRILGLVERAWAEGKKNAEVSGIEDIVKEAIEKVYDKPETKEQLTITTPNIHFDHLLDWGSVGPSVIDGIPNACRTCSNHPSNGGSGICHCIMGIGPIVRC
jgi:hypothetical protein